MPSKNNTTTKETNPENSTNSFNRLGPPFEKSGREVGFRLSGFSSNEAGAVDEGCVELGWFISLYHNGVPVRFIRDIKVYRAQLKPVAVTQYAGEVELLELPIKVEPLFASHHNTAGDMASFEEIKAQPPVLKLTANGAENARLTDLRGYEEAVKVAFLDVEMLRQINLAASFAPEDQSLEMFFSGAEVNYGEMASPHNQHVRFGETAEGTQDPSISFSVKAEALYQFDRAPGTYESANLAARMLSDDERVMLPGLFLLDNCKIYWRMPTGLSDALTTL